MSEMSLLWHEYQRYNELAREVTEDVILLQRARLRLPGHEAVTEEQRTTGLKRLEEFVGAVTVSLLPGEEKGEPEALRLPGTLVERIRRANSGVLPRFSTELHTLREHLAQGEAALTDQDMHLLESLTTSVNQETSRVFNRLWRK
jgi:hypothetical protein